MRLTDPKSGVTTLFKYDTVPVSNWCTISPFLGATFSDPGVPPGLEGEFGHPFVPVCDTFAPVCDTFAPVCDTFAPVCATFAPVCATFAPVCDTFVPVRDTFAPVCDTFTAASASKGDKA